MSSSDIRRDSTRNEFGRQNFNLNHYVFCGIDCGDAPLAIVHLPIVPAEVQLPETGYSKGPSLYLTVAARRSGRIESGVDVIAPSLVIAYGRTEAFTIVALDRFGSTTPYRQPW
jgi:hypothetical protein